MTRQRECEGKAAHPTREAAEAHIWSLVRVGATKRSNLKAYRCPWCDYWHVAHTRPAGKRKGRRHA